MKYLNIGLTLLALGSLAGCELLMLTPATEVEYPGTYTEEYPYATETFEISPDHSFTQRVLIKETKKIYEIRGTWSVNKYGIELKNAFVVDGGVYADGTKHLADQFGKPQVRWHGIYKFRFTKKKCFGAGDEYGPCTNG